MELRSYLKILWRWSWFVILSTLLGLGVSYGVMHYLDLGLPFLPPHPCWEATATVSVGADTADSIAQDTTSLELGLKLAATYAELARRRPVTQAVVEALNLPITAKDLEKAVIEVNLIHDTQLIEIIAIYSDPEMAATIANEAARQLVAQAPVRPRKLLQLIAEAEVPEGESSRPYIIMVLAGLLGLLLSAGIGFLVEYLSDTVRTEEDVTRELGLPSLGVVRHGRRKARGNPWGQPVWWSVIGACRGWENNPDRLESESRGKLILITSPGPGEGKSRTAIDLATVWAMSGQEIILVDAHLCHPALHELLDLSNDIGLSSLLQQNEDTHRDGQLKEALSPTGMAHLTVLTSGPPCAAPSKLLASQPLDRLLDELAKRAGAVILDGSPALTTPDATILASHVDGVLLVLRLGKTTLSEAREALRALGATGGKVLGAVLNQ